MTLEEVKAIREAGDTVEVVDVARLCDAYTELVRAAREVVGIRQEMREWANSTGTATLAHMHRIASDIERLTDKITALSALIKE